MKVFKDLVSGDEICTDTYPIELLHEAVYKVTVKRISESSSVDDSAIGGNASEEGGGETVDETERHDYNIVFAHQLVQTSFTKKDYLTYIKGYLKALEKKLEELETDADEIAKFKKGAQTFVKEVVKEFGEFEFFMGEKANPDGMIGLCKWDEAGTSPYFYFFKHGLEEEKV